MFLTQFTKFYREILGVNAEFKRVWRLRERVIAPTFKNPARTDNLSHDREVLPLIYSGDSSSRFV
jgi:hypothetical protein